MSPHQKKVIPRTLAWISAAIVLGDLILILYLSGFNSDAGEGMGAAIVIFVFLLPLLGIVLGFWLLVWIVRLLVWIVGVVDRKSRKTNAAGDQLGPEDW